MQIYAVPVTTAINSTSLPLTCSQNLLLLLTDDALLSSSPRVNGPHNHLKLIRCNKSEINKIMKSLRVFELKNE